MTERGTRLYFLPASGFGVGASRARTDAHTRRALDPPDFAGAGAPCTRPDADPDQWFPTGNGIDRQVQEAEAAALCAPCPMRVECLEWAKTIRATDGIWGGVRLDGLSDRNRRRQAVS